MKPGAMYIITLGAVMVVCGLYFCFAAAIDNEGTTVTEWLSSIVLIIGGILTALAYNKGFKIGTAYSLMALAAFVFLLRLPGLDSNDIFQYAMSIIFVVDSLVILYFSFSILVVSTPSSMKAIILVGLMAIVDFLPFLFSVQQGTFIVDVIVKYSDNVVRVILFVITIFILTRKEVLLDSLLKRLRKNSEVLSSAFTSDPGIYINRYGVRTLMSEDDIGWIHLQNGPIEMERVIPLFSKVQVIELLLQRWKEDPRIHLTVRNRRSYSFMIIESFVVEKIVLNGEDIKSSDKMRVYGSNGMFMDFLIKDPEELEKTYIETIRWKLQLWKNKKYGYIVDHDRKEFY